MFPSLESQHRLQHFVQHWVRNQHQFVSQRLVIFQRHRHCHTSSCPVDEYKVEGFVRTCIHGIAYNINKLYHSVQMNTCAIVYKAEIGSLQSCK